MYTVNEYAEIKYKKKLYRLSVNANLTCPNRDGKIDNRGCIFCDGGSGDFAGDKNVDIKSQLEQQKRLIAKKLPKTKPVGYIAYFQAFTNTYGPVEKLEKLYLEAINDPEVLVISIATRPDCLQVPILNLLEKINKIKPVWIELGLQTIHEMSEKYIRRGYELSVYDEAIYNLRQINIEHIITHLILGLPGESIDMMIESVEYASKLSDGIKLSMLHVLKGTDLATDYEQGKFLAFTEDEYIDVLKKCLSVVPENVVIHRLSGDGNKNRLIAPAWSMNKKHVLNRINKEVLMK